MAKTTITVHDQTKKRLDSVGQKGKTYDEIINDLIDKATGKNVPAPAAKPAPVPAAPVAPAMPAKK